MSGISTYLNSICPTIWIDGRSKSAKKIAEMRNVAEFDNWMHTLSIESKVSRIGVENLPDTCNERVVLESLFYHGSVTFFEKAGHLIALPGIPTGDITLYGDPVAVNVHGRNGYCEEIPVMVRNGDESKFIRTGATGNIAKTNAKAVWIRENIDRFPFVNITAEYAYKIANVMRTLDVEFANLSHPYLIVCTEDILNDVKNYFNRRDRHEEWIDVVNAGIFDANKVNIINLDMTESGIRDCTGSVEWLLQMFRQLEFLDGSKNVDKKAEITIPELNQGQTIVSINQASYIDFLTKEFDFVNSVFGTNMKPYLVADKVKEQMEKGQEAKMEKMKEEKGDVSGSGNQLNKNPQ